MSSKQQSPKYVVTVSGIKKALADGWQLHVVSQKQPESGSGYQIYGSWYVAIVEPNSGDWAILVTTREWIRRSSISRNQSDFKQEGEIVFREIKTVSGLSSLLLELGFAYIGYPTIPGTSIVLDQH